MNTSAPATACFSDPVTPSSLVCSASQASSPTRPARPWWTTPSMSATTTCCAPAASSSLMIAVPAAPAPDMTIRTSSILFSTTRRALYRAARTTMAVPCWSSWNTGMSSSSRSRRSISKQRGAEMSSRLMPANPGATASGHRDDLVDVLGVQAQRPGIDVAEPLEQRGLALHHRKRGLRPDVAEAEHRRAVGDHRDAVPLDGEPAGVLRVLGDGETDPRHARRVDHREVVAVADRVLGRPSRSCRPGASGRSGRRPSR